MKAAEKTSGPDEKSKPVTLAEAKTVMDSKAKPPGSLGLVEHWGQQLMVLQQTFTPQVLKGTALVYAGDHGILLDEAVAPCPIECTGQVFETMTAGGATCNVLSRIHDVRLELYDVGIYAGPDRNRPGTYVGRIRPGTRNFCKGPALTEAEHANARAVGSQAVRCALRGSSASTHALMVGELGLGNNVVAAALLAALTGRKAEDVIGAGEDDTEEAVRRNIRVVSTALERHRGLIEAYQELRAAQLSRRGRKEDAGDEEADAAERAEAQTTACLVEMASALGGLEIASMVGSFLEARALRAPVLVDGFVAAVAAVIACRVNPQCRDVMFLATRAADYGFALAIENIQRDEPGDPIPKHLGGPMLDASIRLGEGAGAIMCYPLLRSAACIASDLWLWERVLSMTGHEATSDAEVRPAFYTDTFTESSARWVTR